MPLDSAAQAIANLSAGLPRPDFNTLQASVYRAFLAQMPPMPPTDEAIESQTERLIDGPGGPLALRLYRPSGARERSPGAGVPLTVYFHGGGFVLCSLDTHDNICRRLAAQTGGLVISVDYRLAPEQRYPAAVDDALAAVRWVHGHAAELGADAARIAVAGDSAGGALAAVAAQQLRGEIALCHQLLFYPVTDAACDSASMQAFERDAPMLSAEMMRWFWRQYLPADSVAAANAARDPRAAPLRAAELAGVAPATVITAEVDPLRDEGMAYADALARAGVAVQARIWPGQFHGFISLLLPLAAARAALDHGAAQLRVALFDDAVA